MEASSIKPSSNSIRSAWGIRDFKLYWTGQTISMLGDQLQYIAAVWLILLVTADPLTLGLVLALAGIAVAIFSLLGGAVVDHFSPRRVMLFSDLARLLLTASFAALVFSGALVIWMIFVYAFLMGSINGIFAPASSSTLPRILPESDLGQGNLLSQASAQLTGILGPILAAVWIALSPDQSKGIAFLIALDSITFLVSLITLGFMRAGGERVEKEEKVDFSAVKKSTREGLSYVSDHPPVRFLCLVVAAAGFAFAGPVMVGIPYLADTRFPDGVAAYGAILAGYAAGNLLGIIFSNRLPLRTKKAIHILLAAIFIAFGMGLAALAWVSTTWLAAFDLLVMGVLNGYISILLLTGLQRNTPQEFLGRVMSIVIFANMVLMPFSQAIAGALLSCNVQLLFLGAAVLMVGTAIYIYSAGDRYRIGEQLL